MLRRAEADLAAQLDAANRRIAELETARVRAETLFAVTQVLSRTLSLSDTFDAILSELQKVVPYDSSSVQVIENGKLVIAGGRGFKDLQALLGVSFELDDETNPSVQVLKSKRPIVVADVSLHPHFKSEIHGGGKIRGWICVPLLFGDRVIGVITLDKFEADYYNGELAQLATAFAAEAATAIENARLFETERAAREQAETLRAAAQSLGSTLNLRQVFDLILSELRKVVPYDSCSVQQVDGNEMVIVGGHGFPNLDELLGQRFDWRGPDDPAGDVIKARAPVIIKNVSARFEHFNDETHGEGRIKGWMGVPLFFGDRLIGMLTLDKLQEDFYTPAHARLAQSFAAFAASAIENARLFDETQRLLKLSEERAGELAILNSVGEAMAKTLDVKTVTRIVGDKVRDIFSAEAIEILLRDSTSNLIHVPYSFYREYQDVEPFATGAGLTSEVILSGKPLLIATFEQSLQHGVIALSEAEETESYLGVPINAGDQTLGVVSVQSYQQHAFNEGHVRLLETLASNMGVAIANARLFDETQRLLKVTEARNAELAFVNGIQEVLASGLEMQSIYDTIGDKIVEIFDAQVASICIHDKTENLLRFRYVRERGVRFDDLTMPVIGFRKHVIESREPILINEDASAAAVRYGNSFVLQGELPKSIIFVPMNVGGEVQGILFSAKPRPGKCLQRIRCEPSDHHRQCHQRGAGKGPPVHRDGAPAAGHQGTQCRTGLRQRGSGGAGFQR